MPATVTLATATLTYGVGVLDWEITLSSVTDAVRGYRLFVDRELMQVKQLITGSNRVRVKRGTDGTATAPHSSSALVYIGRSDQFYDYDPTGSPISEILVSPWINARDGRVFFSQGDVNANRWWQQAVYTYDVGPLGVRTQVSSPSVST